MQLKEKKNPQWLMEQKYWNKPLKSKCEKYDWKYSLLTLINTTYNCIFYVKAIPSAVKERRINFVTNFHFHGYGRQEKKKKKALFYLCFFFLIVQ